MFFKLDALKMIAIEDDKRIVVRRSANITEK